MRVCVSVCVYVCVSEREKETYLLLTACFPSFPFIPGERECVCVFACVRERERERERERVSERKEERKREREIASKREST